jgi:hypothetical protein
MKFHRPPALPASRQLEATSGPRPAAPQTALNVIPRCLGEWPWSARYPEGNVLHDFMLPSETPENQARRTALARLLEELPPVVPPRPEPGHPFSPAKLTDIERAEIRRRAIEGESYQEVADDYGITRSTVGQIRNRDGGYFNRETA